RFKALNDKHGHPTGDAVLRGVAAAIVSAVREDDVPARFGGEEFVVLLRNPAPGVAVEVGERIRSAVRALDLSELACGASACRSAWPSPAVLKTPWRTSSPQPTRTCIAPSAPAAIAW